MAAKVDVGPVLWTGRELVVNQAVAVPVSGAYTFGEPALVALEIRRIDRQLDVTGTIDVTFAANCDRCLGDVEGTVHIEVAEQFAAESGDPFAESNVLEGTMLDISDLVRQLVDSALPLTNRCSEECAGLCPTCGLNASACRCTPSDSLETIWPT